MKVKLLAISVLLFSAISLSSASLGPVFTEIKDVPKDKSIVYFYNKSSRGAKLAIFHGKSFVVLLPHGGYYAYQTAPGKQSFQSVIKYLFGDDRVGLPIDINLEAGEVYYVEAQFRSNPQRTELKILRAKDALEEIKSCKLVEKE